VPAEPSLSGPPAAPASPDVTLPTVTVQSKGVGRLRAGHPWVYRTDLAGASGVPAGLARLADERGRPLGTALHSPHSEIRVRWLAPPDVTAPPTDPDRPRLFPDA